MLRSNQLRTAAALVAVLVAAACNGADVAAPGRLPVAPASDNGIPAAPQALAAAAQPPSPVKCTPHAPVTGRGRIGPRGGVIMIGGSRLVIPGGALRETVTITGTALGDASSTIDFQPHGLHFQRPAILKLSGAGCSLPRGGSPSIVYLGAGGEVLERIAAVFVSPKKLVTAPISHFSGYAIAF